MLDSAEFLERALIQEGLISDDQLRKGQILIAETECSLEEAMVTLGFMTARALALVRAQLCESPFVDLAQFEINFENSRLIPKSVAERFQVFPLFVFENVATVGIDDPLNLAALDQVRQILKREVDPVQCEPGALQSLIDRAYSLSDHSGTGSREDTMSEISKGTPDEAGPIVAAVNTILMDAVHAGASDVHINPDQTDLHLRFRIDGVLHQKQSPPLSMHAKIVQRLKVMAHLDLTQTRRPQDGKFRVEHAGRKVDIRVSIIPTVTGENVVIRLLNSTVLADSFEDLGCAPQIARQLDEILAQPYGMMLVTGPTGCGKTTTLYTALSMLNQPNRNIFTVEDPVEIRMPMVRQVQVNHEIGMTFSKALRSILRQDPDVILVGEIRDEETASMAIQSSLTGHYVLSTLHTNDAAGAVARLRDFGLPPFVINSAVLAVIAQRLVRRVCCHCAVPATPDSWLMDQFGITDSKGFMEGEGCSRCMQRQFQGRVGVYELMRVTPQIRQAIAHDAPTQELRDIAVKEQMRLMWQDGLDKARLGLTTLAEVAKMVSVIEVASHSDGDGTVMRKSA